MPLLPEFPGLVLATLLAALEVSPAVVKGPPDLHPAPAAARGNEPAEAELTPPPEAEKVQDAPGYVEVRNPAFPDLRPVAGQAADLGPKYDLSSFAPYFAEGTLAAAKASFDKGHYLEARLKLKDAGDSLPVRYLRALSAFRAEDYKTASVEMAALADAWPAMRDRCLTHAGISYEALKDYPRAAELLLKVPPDSRMYADARLTLFRALRGQGDVAGAVDALAPLAKLTSPSWGRDMGAEALMALADMARQRKDRPKEIDALQRLWAFHPLSSMAKQAESRLDMKKMPTERLIDRAETIVDAHRNRQGIKMIEPLTRSLKLPDPLACRAWFVLGKAQRKEREHREAIATLDAVVARCTDPDLRPRALYVLGSSRSIVDVAHGAGTYEALARDYPAHKFADDALYYAADLHLASGEGDVALARLAEISDKYPDGDFAADALFKSFWLRRQRGERAEAMALLDRIEKSYAQAPESYEVERARYWRARMEEGAGDQVKAVRILTQLAVEHPATYYGWIARRRLATLDEKAALRVAEQLEFPPAGNPWPLFAGTLAKDPHFQAGVELLRLGFPEAVSSELLAADRTKQPAQAVRLLVHLLSLVGDQRAAHAVARTSLRGDLSGRITAENRAIWEIAYPLAFRDMVTRHCSSAGLDPDLLQALMREESALDPKALSWAGALGLTQLMPSTANAVAKRLKMGRIIPSRLLEPDLNIHLGSTYLGELVEQFEGTREYAVAGYNAGGGAVNKWRRERPTLELDEWVEEIPIAETRGYVKRVLRSYNTYQLLYPQPKPISQASLR